MAEGIIHSAECHIDGRITIDQKIYEDAAVTVADVNRAFKDWEQKMPIFVRARIGLVGGADGLPPQLIPGKMFLLGIMFAMEELVRLKA